MKNQDFYSRETLEHFRHPHNYGILKNSDGIGEAGNIICGDVMSLYIKVKKNKKKEEVITDVKFKTYGCAAAIATSSVITDLVKGKTINQALTISNDKIVNILKGLPPIKIHCSVLAIDALGEAIYEYLKRRNQPIPKKLEDKHQRIEKSKQQLKERYRKWLALQK